MTQAPELPNLFSILAGLFPTNPFFQFLYSWQNIGFSLLIVSFLGVLSYFASRKIHPVPGRLQAAFELITEALNDFVCGIIGPKGKKYTPFIGTLFIYILAMNLSGLIPFIKAPTSSWSTTFALAICVFFYVQYTAIKELGFLGYLDHLAGRPRGALKFTLIMPLFMFILHIITELIRPLSLSLRLRGNIWGDEVLIGLLANFGIKAMPMLFFNMCMAVLTAFVQAAVFCLLTTIYFALVIEQEELTQS